MYRDSRGDRPHGPAPATDQGPDPAVTLGGGQPAPAAGPGTDDVSIPAIVKFGVGLAVVAAVVQVAMWGLFRFFDVKEGKRDERVPAIVAANLRRTPPEPRLEPNPLVPRQVMEARERAVLESYGWVDRSAGVAHIPIDRAIDLLAEKGLPPAKPMMPSTAPPPLAGHGPERGMRDTGPGPRPTP